MQVLLFSNYNPTVIETGGAVKISDNEAALREVRKHAATIHIAGDLSITDRKLVNVLLLNAYKNLLTQKQHQVPVAFLTAMIWKAGHNDELVKEAASKLKRTDVVFDRLNNASGKHKWTISSLVSEVTIEGGMVTYEYGTEMAKALADPDIYAVINMGIQRKFTSQYALALYENCLRYRKKPKHPGSGSTGEIELAVWRELLNADAPLYDEFRHFNTFVIQKAKKEINQHSDICVEPHFKRTGRKVTHIRFDVTDNPQYSLNTLSDEDAELRESELFRECVKFGIAEDLALHALRTEPVEKLREALRITEEQQKKKPIVNMSRYVEGVLKKLPAVKYVETPAAAPAAPTLPVNTPDEIEKDKRAGAANSATAELTDAEKVMLRDEFIASHPGAKVNPKTNLVAGHMAAAFRTYMNQRRAEVIAKRG